MKERLTAETAEVAEKKTPRILGELCVLCGKTAHLCGSGYWLKATDARMLRDHGRDDLGRDAVLRQFEFRGHGKASGACERVPIEPRRRRERRKWFVIVPAVVSDVGARNFHERVDGRFHRPSFGREIVLQPSRGPRPMRFWEYQDSQTAGRHMLQISAPTTRSVDLVSGVQRAWLETMIDHKGHDGVLCVLCGASASADGEPKLL